MIGNRALWKAEKKERDYDPQQEITRPLYPERSDVMVYNEKGEAYCHCPASGKRRELAFSGFEKERGCLKFRCPAAAYDLACAGRQACSEAAGIAPGPWGRVVRIPLARACRPPELRAG